MHSRGALAFAALLGATTLANAQSAEESPPANEEAALAAIVDALRESEGGGSADELRAWAHLQEEQPIQAREVAENVLRSNPGSFIAHYVLGRVHHYNEASYPRALHHHNLAMAAFEAQFGPQPPPTAPWRWHARILRELIATHNDLEQFRDRIRLSLRYNELYEPDYVAEQAWPLMKLGDYEGARRAAAAGLATGEPWQTEVALNALCAIEFEAGNDGASYEACRAALENARNRPRDVGTVDLTNFAEAARSVFDFEDAERILLEATEADVAWFGNPWLDLAELYLRGGRYSEALSALRRIAPYRASRPPHLRDADRNESQRALAAFYLAVGQTEEALRITSMAMHTPDRRAHNSRDPAQDRAIVALLDRRVRRVTATELEEQAAAAGFFESIPLHLEAMWQRFEGWRSGRQALQALDTDERLIGFLRVGTSRSAIVPPWLLGDLAEVTGTGILLDAVRRARAMDERPHSGAYYDAIAGECHLVAGDVMSAKRLLEQSVASLQDGETLLRARGSALLAESFRQTGQMSQAMAIYDRVLQKDPGAFRRLDLPIPVRITTAGDEIAGQLAVAFDHSPRFTTHSEGFELHIDGSSANIEVCLIGPNNAVFGCSSASPEADETTDNFALRAASAAHTEIFAPRVDLSQADIGSLDGSNYPSRNPLDTLLDRSAAEE